MIIQKKNPKNKIKKGLFQCFSHIFSTAEYFLREGVDTLSALVKPARSLVESVLKSDQSQSHCEASALSREL